MTALSQALTATRVLTPLDEEAEAAVVARAKSGDQAAARILIDNYLGLLMREVDALMRRSQGFIYGDWDRAYEEAFTDAILVFYRVVDKFNPERGRFKGLLQTALRNDPTFNDVLGNSRTMRVSQTTQRRRLAAIRAAGGDIARARELAPEHGLSRETFDAVTQVFDSNNDLPEYRSGDTEQRASVSDLAATSLEEPGFVRIEDLQDAHAALSVLNFEERDVICGLFGLEGWPEHSQHELAAELGKSRQTIRRLRDSAMLKMQAHFQDKE